MTRQELFDTALQGIRSQGRPAIGIYSFTSKPSPGCAYRAPGGCKCAIGWAIPDELYSPAWEGMPGSALVSFLPDILSEEDAEFIDDLQSCHDKAAWNAGRGEPNPTENFMSNFEERMAILADTYNLRYAPPG